MTGVRLLYRLPHLQIMPILDTLKADLLAARKQKDVALTGILSTFVGDLETNSKKTSKPIDDAQIVALAKARISTNKEVASKLAGFDKHAASVLEAEIPVYEKYLPAQLSEAQIRYIVTRLTEPSLGCNLGKVQAHFKANYTGRYDGKLVTNVFKELAA